MNANTIFDNIFFCPGTEEPLTLKNGAFESPSGKRWPIIGGIPRFVTSDSYTASFSFEWKIHKKTQVDSFTGMTFSEVILKQKTGLDAKQVSGKLVLDAGTGVGRHADILAGWGANVVAVDLSYSVEAARENLINRPNVIVAQADIGELPFKPETFDIIISIGVLHHTPDPKKYFKRLVPLLKKGGEICIWVYPKEDPYIKRAAWIPLTSRIPKAWLYRWCRWFVPLAHKNLNNKFIKRIHNFFPFSTQSLGIENNILDTFDGYSPKYHWLHSPEEVVGWFKEAGLVNIQVFPWNTAVRGQR